MKIAEVSERFGLSADTLRFYEKIGLLRNVNRNQSGIRDYNERDLARVDFIKCMRTAGLSLDTLSHYIDLVDEGEGTVEERKQILVEERLKLGHRMAELQKTMDILDRKIGIYSAKIEEKAIKLQQLTAQQEKK